MTLLFVVPKGVERMAAKPKSRKKQRLDLYDKLTRELFLEVLEFDREFGRTSPQDAVLPGRRLQPFYRRRRPATAAAPGSSDALARPPSAPDAVTTEREALKRKRHCWIDLWCKTADMVATYEAEFAESSSEDKACVARAGQGWRARLSRMRKALHARHSDMPEIAELTRDETGKHHVKLGASDVLEAVYFTLYQDEENDEDDAEMMNDLERARWAKDGREFRAFLDDLASPGRRP